MTWSEIRGYKVWVVALSLSNLASTKATIHAMVDALEARKDELDYDTIEIGVYEGTADPVRVWPVWFT